MIDSAVGAPRSRVLLIGAGARAQNNYLPALKVLESEFELVGIHSRTAEKLRQVAEVWNVPAIERLAEVDFRKVDIVAITVPTSQNANVLSQLLEYAHHLSLLVDTPIARTTAERMSTCRLLDQFKYVAVSEDFMNMPQFDLLRRFVESGLIGKPAHLIQNGTGYLYHGLALIRSFVGFAPVADFWQKNLNAYSPIVNYSFQNGFQSTVIGPYRRLVSNAVSLEGTDGLVSEFMIDKRYHRPFYHLATRRRGKVISGYTIEGNGASFSIELPEIDMMMSMNFKDKSDLNLIRGWGLANIFKSFRQTNLNNAYGHRNAYYDHFVSKNAGRGRTPLDQFGTILPSQEYRPVADGRTATDSLTDQVPGGAAKKLPAESADVRSTPAG